MLVVWAEPDAGGEVEPLVQLQAGDQSGGGQGQQAEAGNTPAHAERSLEVTGGHFVQVNSEVPLGHQ